MSIDVSPVKYSDSDGHLFGFHGKILKSEIHKAPTGKEDPVKPLKTE